MARYMITWRLSPANRNQVYKRFGTSARTAPAKLKELGRWHAATADGGYSVVETDDPANITAWLLQWSDLLPYEITPVISDEELGELLQTHKLT